MTMDLHRVNLLLGNLGFDSHIGKDESGEPAITATLPTRRGDIQIFAIARGARIAKPNGTAKYYYEVSDGKFAQYVRQIMKAYK